MAEKEKDEQYGDFCHMSIRKVDNGYEICASYDSKEKSLAQRAGWIPPMPCPTKERIAKSKDSVLKEVKELLG